MRVPSYRGLTFQSIKDSGAVLWHDLMAGHSVEALVDLAGENAELAAGIARFAEEVVSCGLMRPTTEAQVPSGPAATAAQAATIRLRRWRWAGRRRRTSYGASADFGSVLRR